LDDHNDKWFGFLTFKKGEKNTMKIGSVKFEKKKRMILKATFNCIYERGIWDLSLRSIAKEAKVNLSDVFYYFKNKENLLTEFIQSLFKKIESDLTLKRLNKSDSPKKKFDLLFKEGVNFSSKQKKLFVVFIDCWSLGMRNIHFQRIFREYYMQLYNIQKDILENFYGKNVLTDDQIDILNILIFAFFAGMGIQGYAIRLKKPFGYKRYFEEFRKCFLLKRT
jgi:AcrR family transcriptional regulator